MREKNITLFLYNHIPTDMLVNSKMGDYNRLFRKRSISIFIYGVVGLILLSISKTSLIAQTCESSKWIRPQKEKFLNRAHPHLKVTIRADKSNEIGLQIFNQEDKAPMQQCPLTATMGNYSRIRLLHLKNKIVDSRKLYEGFDGIHFVEKKPYPVNKLIKTKKGYYITLATMSESFSELASWAQDSSYLPNQWWRYRPPFKVTQYWKTKASDRSDSSLRVRVNGRAKYWSGRNNSNPSD
jgi:hypothetical protein